MKRVLTALVLIPLIVYVVLWSPAWAVLAVTALVALLCYHEYAGIAAVYHGGSPGPVGYGAGLLVLALPGEGQALIAVVAIALIGLSLALRADDLRAGIVRTAFLVMGVVYVFGCWRFAPLLGSRNRYWLMYALMLNWIGDIGAYYVGRAVGRHKLAPIVSPGKSWEGAAASLAASLLFGYFFLRGTIPEVGPLAALGLTAAANVAGQFGDLCESALKRGAGVKDSGNLLPGHGGMLDRVDSTLFTLPVVYLCLVLMGGW
ncbi:MAG: phosphatidate cytidylyltransferase [Bryobacteraceae bacterium]|jgi:phosphatidate cytidylyltransferase